MKPARRMFTIIIVIAIILQEWRIGRGLEDLHSTSARHRQGEATAHQVNLHIKGKRIIQSKICKKKSHFFTKQFNSGTATGREVLLKLTSKLSRTTSSILAGTTSPQLKCITKWPSCNIGMYQKYNTFWIYNQKGTWNLNLLTAQVQVDTSHKCSKQVVGPLTHWGRDFSREKNMKNNHNLLSLCWRERSNRNNLISLSSRRPWIKIFRDPHVEALLHFDHADPVNEI